MNIKKIATIGTSLALFASIAVAVPAFAQGNDDQGDRGNLGNPGGQQAPAPSFFREHDQSNRQDRPDRPERPDRGPQDDTQDGEGMHRGLMMRSGVFGTVSSVSGNTFVVNGRQGPASTTVAYTVDASNATVRKGDATSTVSSIVAGDNVFVQGTVTGTNVVATSVLDGVMGRMGRGGRDGEGRFPGMRGHGMMGSSTLMMGNGQPIVAGTVSAVNGSSITITTASNVTYTVDASSAKIAAGRNASSTLSNIAVGNRVIVQGTISGTSVAASMIINRPAVASSTPDGSRPPQRAQEDGDGQRPPQSQNQSQSQQPRGFFGGIGHFFSRMFGF